MSDNTNPSDPSDSEFFERLRRIFASLGLDLENMNLEAAISALGPQFNSDLIQGIGFTPADQDPDAAWRTTITAAVHQLPKYGPDPTPSREMQLTIADTGRLADSWLENHVSFCSLSTEAVGWTRAQWITETGPAWRRIVEPIINRSADALGEGMHQQEVPELQQLMAPMLRTSAGVMYREKLKNDLAKLASTLLTGSELGMLLLARPQVVLLPTTIETFTNGLDLSPEDVQLYLTCRETARQRLMASVVWLGPQLDALLEHYAREIRIDLDFISDQLSLEDFQTLNLENIADVGKTVTKSFFKPASSPIQREILDRLETLLALVEGWVDEVTLNATANWLSTAPQLSELIRRRRASGDPAHTVFAALVGLELRPRRIRDAANLWAALTKARGVKSRDAVWSHPDLIPSGADLDDPLGFVAGESISDVFTDLDAELAKLLDQDNGDTTS